MMLSVIIVSYNTRQMTLDCLRTLYAGLGGLSAEVFVVDNASTDGSPAAVREAFPQVTLIANDHNAGFGAANNQAIGCARGEFLLLLNSDAFPEPGAIPALVEYLQAHPRTGVVGPKLLNADGSRQLSCFRFPTPGLAWRENLWISAALPNHPILGDYRRWAHDAEREVDWVIGACLLVRKKACDEAGGFDERFFMYSEETDWQQRIRRSGWKIAFTPTAQVTHLGGASGASDKPAINQHFFDSLDRYVRKHHGLGGVLSLRLAMIFGCSLRVPAWALTASLLPRRREAALRKVRFQSWLLVRQATQRPRPAIVSQ